MTTEQRHRLERVIETMLADRWQECCFWDGDEWVADDMAGEKLARDIVEEFQKTLNPRKDSYAC